MLTLSLGDIWRGLIVAVCSPVAVAFFGVVGAVITAPGFDVFSVAWIPLFHNLTNVLIVAAYGGGSGYILKNLLTDSDGHFLGIPTKS